MLIFYIQLGPSEDIHWRFLAHEQAVAVLHIISHQNPSCQAEMVSTGTIKHLVKLCDIFNVNGSHSNCCQSVYQCSREANALFHDLTFQKKLVGKVTELSLTALREKAVTLIRTGEKRLMWGSIWKERTDSLQSFVLPLLLTLLIVLVQIIHFKNQDISSLVIIFLILMA